MNTILVTRELFLLDTQGKTFTDVVNDPEQPFEAVLKFFNDAARQQRMEDSEIHHDRAALAGVVRELESLPEVKGFLSGVHAKRSMRFRQAIGVLVRIIMEGRGWTKTGRKGSLGVRAPGKPNTPAHNTGGLAFWFVRAERYQSPEGARYETVRTRSEELDRKPAKRSTRTRSET